MNKLITFKIIIFSIIVLILIWRLPLQDSTAMAKLVGLDFEVYGLVQGVFFRKYTKQRGKELGLHGWCMNTDEGTVVGHIEGEKSKIEEMKHWLRHTGSSQSKIDKAEFRNEKNIETYSLEDFQIKK